MALLRPDADELPTDRSQVDQRVPDRKAPHQIPRASHHVGAVQGVPDDCLGAARDQPARVGGYTPQDRPSAVYEHVGSVETVVTSAAQSAAKATVRSLRPLAR